MKWILCFSFAMECKRALNHRHIEHQTHINGFMVGYSNEIVYNKQEHPTTLKFTLLVVTTRNNATRAHFPSTTNSRGLKYYPEMQHRYEEILAMQNWPLDLKSKHSSTI
jgi:hypothetical protein